MSRTTGARDGSCLGAIRDQTVPLTAGRFEALLDGVTPSSRLLAHDGVEQVFLKSMTRSPSSAKPGTRAEQGRVVVRVSSPVREPRLQSRLRLPRAASGRSRSRRHPTWSHAASRWIRFVLGWRAPVSSSRSFRALRTGGIAFDFRVIRERRMRFSPGGTRLRN